MPRSQLLIAALTGVALVAAACGGSEDSDSPGNAADGDTQAIVSLSPTGTEMLYAVGAGEDVVAVDDYSTYPEDAPVTDLSGFRPNLEAILDYEPDLVVLSNDNTEIVAGLERAGVEVLNLPTGQALDDTYTQLEQVGAATGNVGEAAELVGRMQTEIDQIVDDLPDRDEPLSYFHELDETLYTVTDNTYIGQLYSMLGLTSIATGDESFPQMSEELVIEADPDFIFLADAQCCGVTPETVADRPGWDGLTAVQEDRVVVLDEDQASRWGPRIVDLLRDLAETVAESVPVGSPAP